MQTMFRPNNNIIGKLVCEHSIASTIGGILETVFLLATQCIILVPIYNNIEDIDGFMGRSEAAIPGELLHLRHVRL
jgi:hypothetical protein